MFKWLRCLAVLLAGWLVSAPLIYAQTPNSATLFPPDTTSFPKIQVFLDVHDADGSFVHGLEPADVRLLEDNNQVQIEEFSELRPGVQAVLALNPGDSFTIRNSQGKSRYDAIYQTLENWLISRRGSTVDDLSFLAASGPERTHTKNPEELLAELQSFQLQQPVANPNLDVLSQALDVVTDETPRPGMERAILFVTSPLSGDPTQGLQELIGRAIQQRVRIYVWYIASSDMLDSPQVDQLMDLAAQTGGSYFAFSADETIPSPEAYLNGLRDIYRLVYSTQIASAGSHQLVVEIKDGNEQITTPVLEYSFDLQPPDPAFISPVAKITRQVADSGSQNLFQQLNNDDLLPDEHPLQVLIDFPDGRIRPLVATRLYIDGQVVAENTQPPFDQFTWNLNDYNSTARHLLQVEAVDSLGLVGKSIETPVEVVIELPGASPLAYLMQNAPAMIALVIVFSGAIVFLVLIVSGKIRPRSLSRPAGFKRARRPKSRQAVQPNAATQQAILRVEADGRRFSGWVSRLHWPQRRLAPQALAYLVPLPGLDESARESPISIDANEVTLGSDKNQAVLVFDDPSVDALHARLTRGDDGSYLLADQDSIAGTWVNYTPIDRNGARLQHGDAIHIGRVGFQFKVRDAALIRKPIITPERGEA